MEAVLVNLASQPAGKQTGITRTCFCLLRELARRGRFRYVLRSTFRKADLPDFIREGGVQVITVSPPATHLFDLLTQSITVPPLARSVGASIILNMDYVGPLLAGPVTVMVAHDVFHRILPDQYSWRERIQFHLLWTLMTRKSEVIISNSQATANDVQRFYPAARGKIRTALLDTTLEEPQEPAARSPIGCPYVLTVGNGTANKNFRVLGRAFRMLVEANPEVCLVHVGHDPDESIANELGPRIAAARLVRLTGVDDSVLVALYRGATCYVNVSLYEGFCLPIIEAQRYGCPVICSNRGATAEIASDSAILCDPTNTSEISGRLAELLGNPELRNALSSRGLENARRFSWQRAAVIFEDVFGSLIGHTPAPKL